MYKEHIAFETPVDSTNIWRYMNFERFEFLLEKRALYFANFKRFKDHLEGCYPFGNWKHYYNVIMQRRGYNTEDPDCPELTSELVNLVEEHFKYNMERPYPLGYWKLADSRIKQHGDYDTETLLELIELMEAHISNQYLIGGNFINCWHQNEYESYEMWGEYTQKGKGICIKSSIKRFKECFAEDDEHEVKIGTVTYIDYPTDFLEPTNAYYIFTHKDKKQFGHENEVRAYVLMKGREYRNKDGICVPVSLDILIEKIYISPTAEEHLLSSVKAITEKYDLKKEVVLSDLHN